jgi:hypothetical protein
MRLLSLCSVIFLLGVFGSNAVHAQQTEPQSTPSLLVDVIVTDKHANAPALGLTKEDFKVSDGRSAVSIASFAHAPDIPPRPLVIWFIVQCPLEGIGGSSWISNGSGFMKGRTASFTPVLGKLQAQDAVGVAHWCDDGTLGVDLLPTTDRAAPSNSLEKVLSARMVPPSVKPGADALHDLILRLRDTSRQAYPSSLPVLVFLYGDHGGMYGDEADDTMKPPGALPLVYGINNGAVSVQKLQLHPQVYYYIVHYLSDRTGGVVLSTWHHDYDVQLDHVLTELQGRYQLSFIPPVLDGKQHDLNIKLSDSAKNKIKSADLRYAPAFLASPGMLYSPPSPELQGTAALSRALSSTSSYRDIAFDASGKLRSPGQSPQFRLFIDPHSLSWNPLENGDRTAILTLAMAGISAQGGVLGQQVKRFQALQTKADQSDATPKAVILGADFTLPPDAMRVRFVLQDSASGHLGSFELPVSRINKLAPSPSPPG